MDPLEFLGSSIDDFPEPASPGTVSGHDTDKVPKARNDSTSQWSKEQLNMSSLARFQHKWKRAGDSELSRFRAAIGRVDLQKPWTPPTVSRGFLCRYPRTEDDVV